MRNDMTKEEAIGIWLPMVLMAVHDSPQCEEVVKMAARALAAIEDIKTEIEEQVLESLSDGGDDWFTAEKVNECLEIIDKHIAYVRGAE